METKIESTLTIKLNNEEMVSFYNELCEITSALENQWKIPYNTLLKIKSELEKEQSTITIK